MVWYLFTAIGFPPGGNGRLTCAKVGKEQLYTKGEQCTKQYRKRRTQKRKTSIENKKRNTVRETF